MENLIQTQTINIDTMTILFNLGFTFILLLAVATVYQKTHKGLSYSQSFMFTLVVIGLLINLVMMVIGSNIAIAFGALGAFSLIRFRTAVKETKDTVFVFFSVAIGMANGTGNYMLAFLATVFILLVILVLDKINFGSLKRFNYIVSLNSKSESDVSGRMKEVFKKYTKIESLLNAEARDEGKYLNMSFHVFLKEDDKIGKFVSDLEKIDGISKVNIIATKDDVEY